MQSSQTYQVGDVLGEGSNALECTVVTYNEDADGNRVNISYTFRPRADVVAEREAQAAIEGDVTVNGEVIK